MDVTIIAIGIAAMGKAVPSKERLAWGLLGMGTIISLVMASLIIGGLMR